MKIGRNASCPCGSGRKYKKCCLAEDQAAARRRQNESVCEDDILEPEDSSDCGGDRLSPDDWHILEGCLTKSQRKKLAPLRHRLDEAAKYEAKRAEIESAQKELQKHRKDYEMLMQDADEALRHAEALFAEPVFEPMRFTVDELDRAFEELGYPPEIGRTGEFVGFSRRVTDYLLNGESRTEFARKLVCLVPEYVAQERFLDAWIIQHSFVTVVEPSADYYSVVLLCLFTQSLREWQALREQDETELFGQLGIDRDTIRQHGYEGFDTLLNNITARQDGMRAAERFLEEHPQLARQMQARCRAAEDAAVELLQREEGQSLLLNQCEVEPWVHVLSERVAKHPEIIDVAMNKKEMPERLQKLFVEMTSGIADEMATSIFTKDRLQQLRADIDKLRQRLEAEGADESLAISGMFMALDESRSKEERFILSRLCLFSLFRTIQSIQCQ